MKGLPTGGPFFIGNIAQLYVKFCGLFSDEMGKSREIEWAIGNAWRYCCIGSLCHDWSNHSWSILMPGHYGHGGKKKPKGGKKGGKK